MNNIPRGDWRRLLGVLLPGSLWYLFFHTEDGDYIGSAFAVAVTFVLVLGFWSLEGLEGKKRRIVLLLLCGALALIFNGFVLFAVYGLFNPGPSPDVTTLLLILFMLAMTAPVALFLDIEFASLWRTGHTRLWRRWFRR